MKNLLKKIASYFLQGLLALLPLVISLYLVKLLFGIVKGMVDGVVVFLPDQYQDITYIAILTKLVAGILLFGFIVLVGLLIRTIFGKAIIAKIDHTFNNIPGLNTIYKAIRQVVELLTMKKDKSSMRPVLVEYPTPGTWAIGFMTGEVGAHLSPDPAVPHFTVFVPTTPNPTSGFLLILPMTKIRKMDITMEEVVKILLTGGIAKT
jgi:uncharacterized membrane protein